MSTEEDSDSFDSDTDAIIYGTSDHSGESMISGPNISSSSSDDDDHHQEQQISTAAAAVSGGTDELLVPSSTSSSWIKPEAIMIFNVDFRALSAESPFCNDKEVDKFNLNSCGKRVREGENEDEEILMKKDMRREQIVYPLTPSSWSSIWDFEDVKGIFDVPPLSPLSPHLGFGYSQLMII